MKKMVEFSANIIGLNHAVVCTVCDIHFLKVLCLLLLVVTKFEM